jgi:hypothetical protein
VVVALREVIRKKMDEKLHNSCKNGEEEEKKDMVEVFLVAEG